MKRYFLISLLTLPLIPDVAAAEDSQPEIITDWHRETQSVQTVRAKFHLISYDNVFHIQRHATGRFGYINPQHGFWRWASSTSAPRQLRIAPSGAPYTFDTLEARHWHWNGEVFREINNQNRSYAEYRRNPTTGSFVRLFRRDLYRTVDWVTPFLPGRPDKTNASQWQYTVLKQTDSQVWIQAVRKSEISGRGTRESCELHFQRQPARLLATQTLSDCGNHQRVLIYTDVEFNPEVWSEPDLTSYTKTTGR